jgi:hypothetical protein
MTQAGRTLLAAAISIAAALALSACSSSGSNESRVDDNPDRGGGINLPFLGGDDDDERSEEQAGIGVNSFLWRASLDTLNFMPLVSADPFGGVIITDWYTDPATPNERFKATIYILDTRLRADALNISIFKQVQSGGAWIDAAVDPATESQIENAVLRRARELRLGALGN